jgi:hypothetical protein
MMHKKGQGAMEYLMTYGWAILVVIIVGVVLWQMGIFNPSGAAAPGMSGFTTVKPNEWSCKAGVLNVAVVNAAGQQVSNLTATGGSCTNATLSAGSTTTCTATCPVIAAGSRYEATLSLTYATETGLTRSSTGKVWGPAE